MFFSVQTVQSVQMVQTVKMGQTVKMVQTVKTFQVPTVSIVPKFQNKDNLCIQTVNTVQTDKPILKNSSSSRNGLAIC